MTQLGAYEPQGRLPRCVKQVIGLDTSAGNPRQVNTLRYALVIIAIRMAHKYGEFKREDHVGEDQRRAYSSQARLFTRVP